MRPRRRYRKAASAFRKRWKNPIPQASNIKWVYADDGFNGSTTAVGLYQYDHVFRGNSLYDPDATGVGVQPYGYDQVSALYGAYRVAASSITVNWVISSPIGAGTGEQVKCYVIPFRDTVISYKDNADLRTIPFCRYKIGSIAEGQSQRNWVKGYCSGKKIARYESWTDPSKLAGVTQNPASVWYWHVIFDTATIGKACTIYFDVKIKYYSVMQRAQNINES